MKKIIIIASIVSYLFGYEIYKDGTLNKSKMLEELHPDVAKVVWKFNRWHHHVDYRSFKNNKLKRKEGLNIPEGINNYGMKVVKYENKQKSKENDKQR